MNNYIKINDADKIIIIIVHIFLRLMKLQRIKKWNKLSQMKQMKYSMSNKRWNKIQWIRYSVRELVNEDSYTYTR